MVRCNKSGQAGGNAAIVLIVITAVIVLYILFLPPADREALLSNASQYSNTSTGAGQVLLRESPGKLVYISNDQNDYDFPSFTVTTKISGEVITSRSSLYVKNSVFEKKEETMQFTLNPVLTDNVLLSFNIEKMSGALHVEFNGETILDSEFQEGNSPPITLPKEKLKDVNTLKFSVSGPGIAFWTYHEYRISNVKITGDVMDRSQSENVQTLTLTESNLANLKSAQLRYAPVCSVGGSSTLQIYFNGVSIFRGLPDCGMYNFAPISTQMLHSGMNEIKFTVDKGSIMIDNLRLSNKYEADNHPIYYFEMDDANFTNPNNPDNYQLISSRNAYVDLVFPNTEPKRFDVFINGKRIGFSTALRTETRQIDNYLRPGTNSVEIKPLTDLTITEIKIRLTSS
jgi:hypothetical protein